MIPAPSIDRLARLGAPAGYLAAALALVALPLFLVVVGRGTISEAAESPVFYAPTLAALGSTIALLVALLALYLPHAESLGILGLVGFLAALLGTALAVGAAWSYVFVVPYLADNAPELANSSTGSVLVGFVLSYLLMGLGWLLLAVLWLRLGAYRRWAVVLLAVGSVVTIAPMPSRTLLLCVGVACIGHLARREGQR
ncbi:MAG: hypothetical protein M4D85_00825 [Actinomycetota bacterium]|nr:hypothetical protein [Actinomycetota bacterium]MDQ3663753.1 hypothetical protein [Actinomycetota bacterium]